MNTVEWHAANQTALMAAIEAARLQLLGEPADAALARWQAAEQDSRGPFRLATLRRAFDLTPFETQVIALCAGAVLEPKLQAALQQRGARHPTFQLALRAFDGAHWQATAPGAALRYWQLLHVEDGGDLLHTPLRLDERILHYLMGAHTLPAELVGLVGQPTRAASDANALPPSQAAVADQIAALHEHLPRGRLPVFALLSRDPDAGLRCAGRAYDALGLTLLVLNVHDLPTQTHERLRLTRLLERETLLHPGAVYLDAHHLPETALPTVAAFVGAFGGLLCLGSERRFEGLPRDVLHVDLPAPTSAEQITLWRGALGPVADRLNGAMPRLVYQFDLPARQIHLLGTRLQGALATAGAGSDTEALQTRLWQLCRAESRARLDGLAQRITSTATWDDLILPEEQLTTLHEIAAHVAHRYRVYSEWGFARRSSRGLGITALFAGESGTGKTLAAEVIANQLHLDLYRIDLSAVVSKYIGETEKNLARIFDAAESMSAVLLFDEADALFGKRSEVKDSHDRYANIEVSYLLQRMEAYRGLAILTTNFKRNLDSAFLRRLRFIVQFPFPGPADRARIWQRIFPPETPLRGLDYARLAQLNITGGQIRNIALNAAFHAAEHGRAVQMADVLHAARGEYAKQEKPLTGAEIRGWD
ncbi:MAG: ATP-binding protein [Anaerolineae bacterium]